MTCNGKTELTKHRKNSVNCQQEYWDEINGKKYAPMMDVRSFLKQQKILSTT